MSFLTSSSSYELEMNVLISIDGVFYGEKQPVSGINIDSNKLVLKATRINSVEVDVRRVSTPISTLSFRLEEDSGDVTTEIMKHDTNWLGRECIAYVGSVNEAFNSENYKEVSKTVINSVVKVSNGWYISSREVTGLLDREALNLNETLITDILQNSLTLTIADATRFPQSGVIRIENEFLSYSSKDGDILRGLSRGKTGSTAAAHDRGGVVYLVTVIDEKNPIDVLLQVMLSGEGNGTNSTYDILFNGLNLNASDVDIEGIENIRDTQFEDEKRTYYIFNNSSMLRFLEETVLVSTNTRLITVDGKISLTRLDVIDFESDIPMIDEGDIIGTPTFRLSKDKIQNDILIFFDYNPVNGKYESERRYEDMESISLFGRQKPLKLYLRGVKTSLDGIGIADNRGNRLLSRLSTPRGYIEASVRLKGINIPIGSGVQVNHRYLPQQGGTLGMDDRLELMSYGVDLSRQQVRLRLEYTSYTGIRVPFIAPSPEIVMINGQDSVVIDDTTGLKEGYAVKLFFKNSEGLGNYASGQVNFIKSITGPVVSFRDLWIEPLLTNMIIKIADYDEVNEEQRSRYGFIGKNTGVFFDGSKSYQVIF